MEKNNCLIDTILLVIIRLKSNYILKNMMPFTIGSDIVSVKRVALLTFLIIMQ